MSSHAFVPRFQTTQNKNNAKTCIKEIEGNVVEIAQWWSCQAPNNCIYIEIN